MKNYVVPVLLLSAFLLGCSANKKAGSEPAVLKETVANVETESIIDYFPVSVGNTWSYANATGKITDVIFVQDSATDEDGTILYRFDNQMIGLGTVSTVYSIQEDKVFVLASKNLAGLNENKPPYPIELALAGQEWSYNDSGDDLRYKTSKASCSFDGKTYNDCLLVEKNVLLDDNKIFRTTKSYYAKNIGLVYVTLEGQGSAERVFMKLVDCNLEVL